MFRNRADLRRAQKLADPEHLAAGVIPPPARAPEFELLGKISGGLTGERGIGGAKSLPFFAMTGSARDEPARGIAMPVEARRRGRRGAGRVERHPGIVPCDAPAFVGVQLPCDPAHLAVLAAPVGIGDQLALKIPRVEAGQPRGGGAIAASLESVAGEAGIRGAGSGTAQRHQLSGCGEAIRGSRRGNRAAGQRKRQREDRDFLHFNRATPGKLRRFRHMTMAGLLLLLACKAPPEQRTFMPGANVAAGKRAIERVGCGSCHYVPGVGWPQGKAGPSLEGLAERALIAGRLPNRPDVLAAYIRNAPALVPGSGMPAMPVGTQDSQDIVAYLYDKGAR
jgi:Cytochrome c